MTRLWTSSTSAMISISFSWCSNPTVDLTIVSENGVPPNHEQLSSELISWLDDDVPVRVFDAKSIRSEGSG